MLEHSWLGYCGCCLGKMSQSDSIFKILHIPYHTKFAVQVRPVDIIRCFVFLASFVGAFAVAQLT